MGKRKDFSIVKILKARCPLRISKMILMNHSIINLKVTSDGLSSMVRNMLAQLLLELQKPLRGKNEFKFIIL